MKNLIEQFNTGFSVLSTALIISIGITASCGSTIDGGGKVENTASIVNENKANSNNKPVENKAAENKEISEKPAEIVEIYDGRKEDYSTKEATSAEKQLVEKEFKLKESAIKAKFGESYCQTDDTNFGIVGTAEGSFTKPNSTQKAYFYELCRSGSSHFGVGGILVIEDGKAVAHQVYGENGLDNDIFSLPDINKNGVSELVFVNGSTHQGYTGTGFNIVELKDANLSLIGGTSTYSSNSGAMEDESKVITTAYHITVQPSANPTFFRETYEQKGNAKNWKLIKKAEKFTLSKETFGKIHKIN